MIARRISYGARTDEGSRFYGAGLSVIETCRKRGADPWAYARDLIAAARTAAPAPASPRPLENSGGVNGYCSAVLIHRIRKSIR